jgi:hypothetical protein
LKKGQVGELTLSTALAESAAPENGKTPFADDMVQLALATGATVHFLDNAELLADMDGVVASLRYLEERRVEA